MSLKDYSNIKKKLATKSLQCKCQSGAKILINRVKHGAQGNALTRVINKEDLGVQAVQSYSEIPEVTKQYERFGKCLQDNVLVLMTFYR